METTRRRLASLRRFFRFFVALCHPFRQLDLFLRRKQRNTSDLFQIYLDRVVDVYALSRYFFLFLILRMIVRRDGVEVQIHILLQILDDLDVQLFQFLVELVHLFYVKVHFLQRIGDLLGGQFALGFTQLDQIADDGFFLLCCHSDALPFLFTEKFCQRSAP